MQDFIPHQYSTREALSFIEQQKSITVNNRLMICYVVIFYLKQRLNWKSQENISKILSLQVNFLFFIDKRYNQTDGVAIGLPFSSITANIFIGCDAKQWINKYNHGWLVRHIGQALLGKGDHSLFFMDLVSIMVT